MDIQLELLQLDGYSACGTRRVCLLCGALYMVIEKYSCNSIQQNQSINQSIRNTALGMFNQVKVQYLQYAQYPLYIIEE